MDRSSKGERRAKLVVVGCGGNIGSHLIPHLARMSSIDRLTLIDPDVYETQNLISQNINRKDIGRPKATVQAKRLRQFNPDLQVEVFIDPVGKVPLGKLRGDLIVGCLDNNAARLYLSEASWRLGGIPYIDAGVQGEGLLARVNIYKPGPLAPCLECSWDSRDYEQIEQIYPCQGDEVEPAATNSPASLGSLAASLQAIECWKMLTGQWEWAVVDRQILLDVLHHKHYVSSLRRSPHCRFDHEIWTVERLRSGPRDMSLGQALSLGNSNSESHRANALRYEGMGKFITQLSCSCCGAKKALLRLEHRLRLKQSTCWKCGNLMAAPGFDMLDSLKTSDLTSGALRCSLKSIGFHPFDIFTIMGPSGELHYEIGSGCSGGEIVE